jgi:hypothetical protein
VSPELCPDIRWRSRVMCPWDPLQHPVTRAESLRLGPRPICQASPLQPLHLDRPSRVGWPGFTSDQAFRPFSVQLFYFGRVEGLHSPRAGQVRLLCLAHIPGGPPRSGMPAPYFVSPASGQTKLCRIRFWYLVSSGAGCCRETCRIFSLGADARVTAPFVRDLRPKGPDRRTRMDPEKHRSVSWKPELWCELEPLKQATALSYGALKQAFRERGGHQDAD